MLLLGFKLSALRRLVQVNQRRKELKSALSLLLPKLEDEDLTEWLSDLDHDAVQRENRIGEMALPSGRVYSGIENEAVERCQGMFALFDSISASVTHLKRSATIKRLETKYDEATRRVFGLAEAEVRADLLDIVAYLLNFDSRHMQSSNAANARMVRFDCLERIDSHHTVVFLRYKLPGMSDRTFLMSFVAKHVSDDPPTVLVALVPIPRHDKIGPKDEAGAVRAENCRSFRCTEVAPGVTKLEYCCSLDLKGWIPQIVTDTVAVPAQLKVPATLARYFQQIRPPAKCDVDDGRIVGQMLLELAEGKPKDLPHAIRQSVNRTAMLRDCSFRHIGAMLARMLSADAGLAAEAGDDDAAVITVLSPSSATEHQASAIGRAIVLSVRRSHVPAAALQRVVQSHAVLQAMNAGYVWFVPMLEVITARKATALRGSSGIRRFSSIVPAKVPSDETLYADGADEENRFSSVVRLGERSIVDCLARTSTFVDRALASKVCVWLQAPG